MVSLSTRTRHLLLATDQLLPQQLTNQLGFGFAPARFHHPAQKRVDGFGVGFRFLYQLWILAENLLDDAP